MERVAIIKILLVLIYTKGGVVSVVVFLVVLTIVVLVTNFSRETNTSGRSETVKE